MVRPSLPAGPRRIVSGGQTGVDRAALEVALALNLEHGGWCPRGRLAEDGTIPSRYQLTENDSTDYAVRTEQNVLDSDGTLILYRGPLQGGTDLTRRFARRHRKPCLLIDLDRPPEIETVLLWLQREQIATLNVAGPRESSSCGIGAAAFEYLLRVLQ